MVIFPFEETLLPRPRRRRQVRRPSAGRVALAHHLPRGLRRALRPRPRTSHGSLFCLAAVGRRSAPICDYARAAVHLCPSEGCEFLLPVASTLDRCMVSQQTIRHDNGSPSTARPAPLLSNLHLVPDARDALHHARASVVASGTATVQAAVIGNPFSSSTASLPLTFAAAKRLVRYPAEIWPAAPDAHGNLPIGMVNLIAGRRIVPELLQQQFTAANVAAALRPLLDDTPERARMIADLAEVRQAPPAHARNRFHRSRFADAVGPAPRQNRYREWPKIPPRASNRVIAVPWCFEELCAACPL